MKIKNFLIVALVFSFSLMISGCKGTTKDLDKQIEKIREVKKDGEIFENDYKIINIITKTSKSKKNVITNTIKRDGNKMYVSMDVDGELATYIYLGEVEGKWYVFYGVTDKDNDSNNKKIYAELPTLKAQKIASEYENEQFENLYSAAIESLEEYKGKCLQESVTCEVNKDLFGKKVTFDYREGNTEFTIEIDDGKIQNHVVKSTIEEAVMDSTTTFYYDDQGVGLPSRSFYTYSDSAIDYVFGFLNN